MKKKVVSVLLCVAMTATMLLGCSAEVKRVILRNHLRASRAEQQR